MDCKLPARLFMEIFRQGILEWIAIFFSRGSSWPGDRTWVSCIAGKFFTNWATREDRDMYVYVKTKIRNKSMLLNSMLLLEAYILPQNSFSISSVQSLSCVWLCDPMDCSTPGFCVYLQLLEPAQIHVHWVGDAIQLSHALLSPSPPAFNLTASGSFPVSQFFVSGGLSTGASASASVLPMNIQS